VYILKTVIHYDNINDHLRTLMIDGDNGEDDVCVATVAVAA
jgi:hypothetical protein